MANPKQQIDSYLGYGWYDQWQKLNRQAQDEDNRYGSIERRLKLPITSALYDRIDDDFRLMYKIKKDYDAGMDLVANGGRPNKQKLDQQYELYSLAVGVVENENDVLEALWATGFAAAWVVVPWMLLQAKANLTREALERLKEELEKAEKELSHAKTKQKIHAVTAFFEAMFPEISLAGRALIYLGDVALDKALGPDDASTAQKYTGDVLPGVKQFSEAVHGIPKYSHAAREVAERTGKVATVATFYIDYEEVAEGSERVEKLEKLTREVKRAYDELVQVIETNKPRLERFLMAFEQWIRNVDSIRQTAGNVRQLLRDDITKFGYSTTQAVVWTSARGA